MYGVNGKLSAQPGEGPRLLSLLMEAARGMENVDGCLFYIVGTDENKPEDIWVFEVWTDAQAHQASLKLPVFQTLIEKARPLIAGMDNLPGLTIHGGKAGKLH